MGESLAGPVWRFFALFLSVTLILPNPAFALRPGSAIEDSRSRLRVGLEEALRGPASGMEAILRGSTPQSPSLQEIESKVFAVHATRIFPANGVLKAGTLGAYAVSADREDPPSFRATVHFSLGELVQPHVAKDFSWEDAPFAVVAPLKALEKQLVNLFPGDTFVLGSFRLSQQTTLLVPKGTDVSMLPPDIPVLEYDPGVGLRVTVGRFIKDQGGWPIHMLPGGLDVGSVAYWDEKEINSPVFFERFLEEHPYVSYGNHIYSERGEVFRLGSIDLLLNRLMMNYFGTFYRFSTPEVKFLTALIRHHLARLDELFQAWAVSSDVFEELEEKKRRLSQWLEVADADLEIRQTIGKSLTGAPREILERVKQLRTRPGELRAYLTGVSRQLPVEKNEDMEPIHLSGYLEMMPPEEVWEFMANNAQVFDRTDRALFGMHYAIGRWLVVDDEKAKAEGIGSILDTSLQEIQARRSLPDWEAANPFVGKENLLQPKKNTRLVVALGILRNPTMKEFLARYGIRFSGGGPQTLEEILRAFPETKEIFEQKNLAPNPNEQEGLTLLERLGYVRTPRVEPEALESYRGASSLALGFRLQWENLHRQLQTIQSPMRNPSVPNRTVNQLNLYELMRRDHEKAVDIWRKLGLADEFSAEFPSEALFWESKKSFLQIYLDLRSRGAGQEEITDSSAVKSEFSAGLEEAVARIAAATTSYDGLFRNGTELAADRVVPHLNIERGRKITLEVDLNQLGDINPADIAAIGRIFSHTENIIPSAWRTLPHGALPPALNQARDFLAEKDAGPTDLALVDPGIAKDTVGEWGEILEGRKMPGIVVTSVVLSALNNLKNARDLAFVLAAIRQAGGVVLGFEIEEKDGQRKLYLYA